MERWAENSEIEARYLRCRTHDRLGATAPTWICTSELRRFAPFRQRYTSAGTKAYCYQLLVIFGNN
eukprot:2042072-Rhodomonas_salina.1